MLLSLAMLFIPSECWCPQVHTCVAIKMKFIWKDSTITLLKIKLYLLKDMRVQSVQWTDYGPGNIWVETEFWEGQEIFLLSSVSGQLWGPPSLNPVNTGGYFQEIKIPQLEPDHLSQFRAEVKNEWSYTSHSPVRFYGVWWHLSKGILSSYLYLIRHHLKMSMLSLSWTKNHGTLRHWGVEEHLHAF